MGNYRPDPVPGAVLVKCSNRDRANRYILYAATELISLLTDCGFNDIIAYGDLAGSPYDHRAKRLVVMWGENKLLFVFNFHK